MVKVVSPKEGNYEIGKNGIVSEISDCMRCKKLKYSCILLQWLS